MIRLTLATVLLAGFLCTLNGQTLVESADGASVSIENTTRIITIGGSISETVFALGKGDFIIATDQSTTFPTKVFQLPRVPYVRNLTSEGILSLSPTLILASDDASPASAIQQIRDAQVDLVLIKKDESLEGVIHKIKTVGAILGEEQKAAELIQLNTEQFEDAEKLRASFSKLPTVMFILAVRGENSFMIAGNNTAAASMIRLAGGKNAFDSFEGYKNASMESILSANPDFIVVMQSRFEEISNGVKKSPGVNITTAVQKDQIIGMDGNLLLGFGPRFGSAILELMQRIHPEEKITP
ncbi:MAG: hemin ABC transporter substrate-binding protein [Balneolaceae bacterium]